MFKRDTKPTILASGIDRLTITIVPRTRVSGARRNALADKFIHEVAGSTVAVINNPKLEMADKRELADFLLIDSGRFPTDESGPVFRLTACAATCAGFTSKRLLQVCSSIARVLLGSADPEVYVSYLELYADFQGVPRPEVKLFKANCITRAKSLSILEDAGVLTPRAEDRRSLMIGRGGKSNESIHASFYEKSLSPTDWRWGYFRSLPGFDESKTITRLEYRIPSASCWTRLKLNSDLKAVIDGGLNAMWVYLTSEWLRVLAPGQKGSKRARVHGAWEQVMKRLPIPDTEASERTYKPAVCWDGFERSVLMGGGLLRSCAGLPDNFENKCLAYLAFLDAVEMLSRGELPFGSEQERMIRAGVAPMPVSEDLDT